ncbi:MAG: S8 family serine peptidase [bacterium]|nr:S8 family serine peptidase [bacterium]
MQKKPYLFVLLGVFAILAIPQGFLSAQTGFDIDFLNLNQTFPALFQPFNKIQLKEAWTEINKTNPVRVVKIGIIDSGVDLTGERHPEFRGVNIGNTPADAKTDTEPADIPGASAGHGTQVAGIIGANNISFPNPANYTSSHMNGILSGVHSLNYTLEVRKPTFVGTSLFSMDAWSLFTQINNLADEGVGVINISAGSAYVPGFADFFFIPTFTLLDDILFVVAAGNDDSSVSRFGIGDQTPANYGESFDNVITVGSTIFDDSRLSFSNFGSAVNIAAPGLALYAPAPRGKGNFPSDTKDYDNLFSATSASAPMVTGVAGLIKAIKPLLTPAEIKAIITRSADPITTTDPSELTKTLGQGCVTGTFPAGFRGCRLNALKAVCDPLVLACDTLTPPSPFVLHAGGGIIVRDGNRTSGEMKANASISFDDNNIHQGNVVTNFLVSSGSNSRIEGDVGYNFFVLDFPGTPIAITGTITTPTAPPNVILPVIPPFPAGTITVTISSDAMLPPGNYGNLIVENGATLTLLDGIYNFDELVFFNPDTSLRFGAGTVVNVNEFFFASVNVRILPVIPLSSVRLPLTVREIIAFTLGNTASADFRTNGMIILTEDSVIQGNIHSGNFLLIMDNNRINVPPLPPLLALQATNPAYPMRTTPPLDTLNWMEENIMTALSENNAATATREEIGRAFEEARAVME